MEAEALSFLVGLVTARRSGDAVNWKDERDLRTDCFCTQ
jgi:hypothetical protein